MTALSDRSLCRVGGLFASALVVLLVTACGGPAATPTRSVIPTVPVTSGATDPPGPVDTPTATGTPDATDPASPSPDATATGTPPVVPSASASGGEPGIGIPLPDFATLATGVQPDGWQAVEDATAMCRMAVPGDWTTDVLPGTGQSDVLGGAIASVTLDTQDWETFKQNTDQFLLPGHTTLIDTEDMFLIAAAETGGSYLLAIRGDVANCSLLVIVQGNALAELGPDAGLISQTLAFTE